MPSDLERWLETALPRALPDFLPPQRWFGGKARSIQRIDVEDAVWLADTRQPCVLVIASLRYAGGERERYTMLLAFVEEQAGRPVVARLDQAGSARWAVEAAADADVMLGLLRGFASTETRELPTLRGGRLRYGDASVAAARALANPLHETIWPVVAEQSNTSVRLGPALVFKLFRKLDEGVNPELEVGRFLTARTRFRAMPLIRGSLTHVSADGVQSTVGVLHDWVENRGDGWQHILASLRELPAGNQRDVVLRDLFTLGEITADFHAALATDAEDPAFAPEPVTKADVEVWKASFLERASHACALVEENILGWPEKARRMGTSLLNLRDHAASLAVVPEPVAPATAFHKIRVHGDYHLGQTLKTADSFILIDFEGEVARPLAERRLKHCALKDVAGMIRSFDYAVETVRNERGETPGVLPAGRLRESFLDGYLSAATRQRGVFLPEDWRALDAWIDFFEVEKALYEVEYEINNRPAWVHIPLRGIVRILHGGP